MRHRKSYMYVNFQQYRVNRSVKTVLCTQICLQKIANPPRKDIDTDERTERQTDGRMDIQTSRTTTIGIFF